MSKRSTWIFMAPVVLLAACGTKGGWTGAAAEKQYDKEREAARLAEARNSDDYYEYHQDGEILVLADRKDVQVFLTAGEIPLRVTQVGAGPNGERLVFALVKNEAKAMEKKVGYKGGAQQMYEGMLEGYDKGFYGEILKNGRYYVFGDWPQLKAFRRSGSVTPVSTGTTADGRPVVFATNRSDALARFRELHGGA